MTKRLISLSVVALALSLAAGCRSTPDNASKVTGPLTTVKAEHTAARADIATIIATSNQAPVTAAAKSADGHVVNADRSTDQANTAAIQLGNANAALLTTNQSQAQKIIKLDHQFFSPLQIKLAWLLLLLIVIAIAIFGYVHGAIWGAPLITAGEVVFNCIKTGGLYVFHWLGQHLAAWLHRDTAAPSTAATPLTLSTSYNAAATGGASLTLAKAA